MGVVVGDLLYVLKVPTTTAAVIAGEEVKDEDADAEAFAAAALVVGIFSNSNEGSVLLQGGFMRVSTSSVLAF